MEVREAVADSGLAPLTTAIRWGTLSVAVLGTLAVPGTHRDMPLAVVLVLYSTLRTVEPIVPGPGGGPLAALSLEAVLGLVVVVLSGGWGSPFLLTLGATLVIAGLDGGVVAVAVVSTILLGAAAAVAFGGARAVAGQVALERVGSLAVVGAVGAYARWVLHAGHRDRQDEVHRLRAAYEVNSLLLELYARVAGGPVTLSLRGALAATVERLRAVLSPDVVALLLADTDGGSWQVVVDQGASLPVTPEPAALPAALRAAAATDEPVVRAELAPGEGIGPGSASGIYASLRSGSGLVGVLAVERGAGRPPFSAADATLAAEVARHGGLAIDNARWFGRLHTLGAAAERGRIARELHDRVGQSLAATGFGMDGLAARVASDPAAPPGLAEEISHLARELHCATRGVREELADLRTETAPGADLGDTIGELLARVRSRSGLFTELTCDAHDRPSPAVEREIWRIAQEAVLNAERHADASRIEVRWSRSPGRSVLEVVDDGRGIDTTAPARSDAYGLVGMRERADAIGAQLVVASPAGAGTTVRLQLVGE